MRRFVARTAFVAIACSLLLFAALVTAASGRTGDQALRPGANVEVVGGSPAQRRFARVAALRVAGLTIRRVVFRPPGARLRRRHVRRAEMVVISSPSRTLRAHWEALLFTGTYLALSERYRAGAVGAISAGDRRGWPVRTWPEFDVFGPTATASQVAGLRKRLTDAARVSKVRVIELRVVALPARAIALTLRVADPAAFLKHRARAVLNQLIKLRAPLAGHYVGLEDSHGRLVWAWSGIQFGEGGVFVIPRLDTCSPIGHSQFVGFEPPPCPAP